MAPDLAVHDQPELRDGLAQRELVTPGERYDMDPPCFAMAHHLREGHRLVLRVTTSDPDKVPMFAEDVQVTVFTGPGAASVDVPSIATPLYPDTVPLTEEAVATGRAAPFESSITTAAPGGGQRIDGVTSQFVEFDVPEGSTTPRRWSRRPPPSRRTSTCTCSARRADGSWGDDIASGASSDLAGETMTTTRLAPGTYRIEVHNWAGAPGNTISLKTTFFNSAGEAGT